MPDNAGVAVDQELRDELARLIVESLELSFEITQKYGFKLRSDDERNDEIFASLNSLTRHIAENRKS